MNQIRTKSDGWSQISNFNAGRPKVALLYWFLLVVLYVVLSVIDTVELQWLEH